MVKNKLEQKTSLKSCYGTDEWSDNSGICRNCKSKKGCDKMNKSNKNNI